LYFPVPTGEEDVQAFEMVWGLAPKVKDTTTSSLEKTNFSSYKTQSPTSILMRKYNILTTSKIMQISKILCEKF